MNSDLTTKMERDKQDEEDDCETVLDKIKIENLTIVEKLKFVLCFLLIVKKISFDFRNNILCSINDRIILFIINLFLKYFNVHHYYYLL